MPGDSGHCAAATGAHKPFPQLFEGEHAEGEGDDEEPDDDGDWRGAKERVAPRSVNDQGNKQDLRRDAGKDKLVAHEATHGDSGLQHSQEEIGSAFGLGR